MKTSYFLCMTDFQIIKQNTWKFNTRVIFLKFTISVSGSHCDCSHWVLKNLAMQLGLRGFHLYSFLTISQFFNLSL
jgi:hypothetical protein